MATNAFKNNIIYFIRVHNFCKIGITANLSSRMTAIQCGCPYKIELIRIINDCMLWQESWLHEKFSSLHVHLEWYQFTDEMLTIQLPAAMAIRPRSRSRLGHRKSNLNIHPEVRVAARIDKTLAELEL